MAEVKIENFRIISSKENRAEVVYNPGRNAAVRDKTGLSICHGTVTRHVQRVGKNFQYQLDAILGDDGEEIFPEYTEIFI